MTISMKRRVHPQQMEAWVAKLQSNMRTFLDTDSDVKEDRLVFIRQQYVLLDIVVKVLNSDVYFVGCSHLNTK